MPLPVIPGVVRAAVSGTMPSLQPWTNVWHFRFQGGSGSPTDSDLAALDALFYRVYVGTPFGSGQPWLSRCVPAVTLAKIAYVRLDGSSLGFEQPRNVAATGTGSSLPSECAPVLTLRSTQRGRSHRGRVYLPAPAINQVDVAGRVLSTVTVAMVAQVQGLMTALGGPLVTPFWEAGIASYLLHSFSPLALPTMDGDVDVQRRRKK
jgi:hypothetical protein